jgi:predicted outer membrane repeat protein
MALRKTEGFGKDLPGHRALSCPAMVSPLVRFLAVAALALASLLVPVAATANTITVNTTLPVDAAKCTITSAILAAESDSAVAGCAAGFGPDVIVVPAGTYTIYEPYELDFYGNSTAFPYITTDITIEGEGPDRTFIERYAGSFFTFRFFTVEGRQFAIKDLTLRGGRIDHYEGGGAILARNFRAHLFLGPSRIPISIDNVAFTDNSSPQGGAVADTGWYFGPFYDFTIEHATFTNNRATLYGGGVFVSPGSSLTLRHSHFEGNHGGDQGGGGVATLSAADAPFDISDTTFVRNTAVQFGGAIYNTSPRLLRVTLDGNSANGGGALFGYGGRPVIEDSTFKGNRARRGGAIQVVGGSIDIDSSTFTENMSTDFEAGVLYLDDRVRTSRIVNSTISGNFSANAGAITLAQGALTINNSTIVFNTNTPGGGSVAIYPGFNDGSNVVTLSNSIVAGNSSNGVPQDFYVNPISGDGIASAGHNVIGNNWFVESVFTQPGDIVGTPASPLDPRLLDLLDNGGHTMTHALGAGSPALDAGSPTSCEPVDQRGRTRPGPASSGCDAGAYEHGIYYTVTVRVFGQGSVSGLPGIAPCTDQCTIEVGANTQLTFTATPDAGHALSGWAGACSGTGPCAFTVIANRTVEATFGPVGGTTATTLSIAPNPADLGQEVTLTAQVSTTGLGQPTGTVRFLELSTGFQAVEPIDVAGVATLRTSSLPRGLLSFQALYSGDAVFGTSTSTIASLTVGALANVAPSFTMPAAAPAIDEDAGVQLIEHFTTALIVGPAHESSQNLIGFTLTPIASTGNLIFTGGPILALDGTLTYVVAANSHGSATFRVTLQDDGGTANGGQDTSAPRDLTITVRGINDAPMITVPEPLSINEGSSLVFGSNGNQISIADSDDADNFVSGDETLGVSLTVTNGTLVLSTTAGLTFSSGSNGGSAMTFTGALNNINAALNGLTYLPAVNFTGLAMLTMTANDLGNFGSGGPLTDFDLVSITVIAAKRNLAPINTVPGPQTVTINNTWAFSAANGNAISVADPDDADAPDPAIGDLPVQVTLTVNHGTLTLNSSFGLSFAFSDANGIGTGDGAGDATMRFRGMLGNVNAALNGLTYLPAAGFTGADGLTIATNDLGNFGAGGALTDTDAIALSVAHPNEPPTVSVPGPQSIFANSSRAFSPANGNAISVSDPDDADAPNPAIGDQPVQVMLSVNHGTLTLNSVAGLSFAFSDANGTGIGDGSSDASMRFRGSLVSVNAALAGLIYQPTNGFSGADGLTITVNDLGHFGTGGALFATAAIDITVRVNHAPVAMVPGTQSVSTPLVVFSSLNGNGITVSDANDLDDGAPGDEVLTVALSALGTTLTLSGTAGLTFSAGANAAPSMKFSGTITNINVALNGLALVTAGDFDGALSVTVNDALGASHGGTIGVHVALPDLPTSLTVSASPAASVFGQPVVFTARIATTPPGTGIPVGLVTLVDVAARFELGTGVIDSTGAAIITSDRLPVGLREIDAVYSGSGHYLASRLRLTHSVSRATSVLTLTSSVNPSVKNQGVGFTAAVAAAPPGSGQPTGTVTFEDVTTGATTSSTLSNGRVTMSVGNLTPGTHLIRATYSGDDNFTGHAATIVQTVNIEKFGLTVAWNAGGAVSIGGSPATCPSPCSIDYERGTLVIVSAEAAPGAVFFGWSGDCVGLSACVVTMDRAHAVSAQFVPGYPLTAPVFFTSVSPEGTPCPEGAGCRSVYPAGTQVTVRVNAGAELIMGPFHRWAPPTPCPNPTDRTCVVIMNGPKTVDPDFRERQAPEPENPGPTARITRAGVSTGFISATGPLTPVLLSGATSSDPDGLALTYAWSFGAQTGDLATFRVNLPPGNNTVALTVTASDGGTHRTTAVVTVVDNTQPVIFVPANLVIEVTDGLYARLPNNVATAVDAVWGPVPVQCGRLQNGHIHQDAIFQVGEHTGTCRATDGALSPFTNQPLFSTRSFRFMVVASLPRFRALSLVAAVDLTTGATKRMKDLAVDIAGSVERGQLNRVCNSISSLREAIEDAVARKKISLASGNSLLALVDQLDDITGCSASGPS